MSHENFQKTDAGALAHHETNPRLLKQEIAENIHSGADIGSNSKDRHKNISGSHQNFRKSQLRFSTDLIQAPRT